MTRKHICLVLRIVTGITMFAALSPRARTAEPIDIGDRRELFLDRPWEGIGGQQNRRCQRKSRSI